MPACAVVSQGSEEAFPFFPIFFLSPPPSQTPPGLCFLSALRAKPARRELRIARPSGTWGPSERLPDP